MRGWLQKVLTPCPSPPTAEPHVFYESFQMFIEKNEGNLTGQMAGLLNKELDGQLMEMLRES